MRRGYGFPRQDHEFKEFRGFPGIELGIFRVAKSSGGGRSDRAQKGQSETEHPRRKGIPAEHCILSIPDLRIPPSPA